MKKLMELGSYSLIAWTLLIVIACCSVQANQFPTRCACGDDNSSCNITSNSARNQADALLCIKTNNQSVCCENTTMSESNMYSNCMVLTFPSLDDNCTIAQNRCIDKNNLTCNNQLYIEDLMGDATCVAACPCGYTEMNRTCEQKMSVASTPLPNSTPTTVGNSSTTTDCQPEGFIFPIYEIITNRDGSTHCGGPNKYFWIVVFTPVGVFMVISILITIACMKRRNRRQSNSNANNFTLPPKEHLDGKQKGKEMLKRQQTIPNDYTRRPTNVTSPDQVTPDPDYGAIGVDNIPLDSMDNADDVQQDYQNVRFGADSNNQGNYENAKLPAQAPAVDEEDNNPVYGNLDIIQQQNPSNAHLKEVQNDGNQGDYLSMSGAKNPKHVYFNGCATAQTNFDEEQVNYLAPDGNDDDFQESYEIPQQRPINSKKASYPYSQSELITQLQKIGKSYQAKKVNTPAVPERESIEEYEYAAPEPKMPPVPNQEEYYADYNQQLYDGADEVEEDNEDYQNVPKTNHHRSTHR